VRQTWGEGQGIVIGSSGSPAMDTFGPIVARDVVAIVPQLWGQNSYCMIKWMCLEWLNLLLLFIVAERVASNRKFKQRCTRGSSVLLLAMTQSFAVAVPPGLWLSVSRD
jgi:hypothetical protein